MTWHMEDDQAAGKLLLVDTCGERGSVALARQDGACRELLLESRAASSTLVAAVRDILQTEDLPLSELAGIAVINGPGSFTGIRVGIAVVKGLCVAADLPAVALSRLAVLAETGAGQAELSVLRAGRDEFYVREEQSEGQSQERLVRAEQLAALVKGRRVAFAEESVLSYLTEAATATLHPLSAQTARAMAWKRWQAGADDLATLDADYVRDEQAIYRRVRDAGPHR